MKGVRWEDVTKIQSYRRTRFLPFHFIIDDLLIIEAGPDKFVFSNYQFLSGTLMSMFRAMADKRKEYPHIKIEDECRWLTVPD